MKFMKLLLIIGFLLMGCEKESEPVGPEEPPAEDHEQGEINNS